MTVHQPRSVTDATRLLADGAPATLLAGGTDLMVGVNAGHLRPDRIVHLGGIDELRTWTTDGSHIVIGAGVTYGQLLEDDLAALCPGLAQASRTVGSPQIRNVGTIGGNLATASPAGDTLPVLATLDATVQLASTTGTRSMALSDFITGPKRTALRHDELICSVTIPVAAGPQEYLKVGVRNAMVIALCSVALSVDLGTEQVAVALGAAGPVPIRATLAERWVVSHVDFSSSSIADPRTLETFGSMVADAARPIDDHRGTAAYRRHAVGVLARRALARAFPARSAVAA